MITLAFAIALKIMKVEDDFLFPAFIITAYLDGILGLFVVVGLIVIFGG